MTKPLPTETQHDFARSILVRVQVHADRIDLDVGSSRLVSWLLNQGADEGIVEGYRTSSANADGYEQTLISLSIRASLKRTGKEMKFIVEGVTNSAPADTTLIRLLVRGQKIAKRMFEFELSAARGHRARGKDHAFLCDAPCASGFSRS